MNFSSLALSAIKRFRGNVGANVSARFVQLEAPLALRELRCIGHRALAHKKSKNYAPSAPDTLKRAGF